MTKKTRRVKILTSEYDSQNNIILWGIKFLDNVDDKSVKIAWRASDIQSAFNIKGDITTAHVKMFSEIMLGKELNLEMTANSSAYVKNPKSANNDELDNATKYWHEYPFWECYCHEQENK